MATYSSVLAWRIPGMGEPGGLLSMGVAQSQTRLSDLAAAAATVRSLLLVDDSEIRYPVTSGPSSVPLLAVRAQPLRPSSSAHPPSLPCSRAHL